MELENSTGNRCLLLQPSKHKQQRYLQRAHFQWEAPKVLNSSGRADVHSSLCRSHHGRFQSTNLSSSPR